MKFLRRGATATALLIAATGATVLTGTTAAQAAPVTTNYTCTAPGIFNSTFPVTVNLALLPPSAPAGFPLPAGLLSYTSTVTIPADVAGTLNSFGVNGGKADDFSYDFGGNTITAPALWDSATTNVDSSVTFSGKGANAATVLPKAGTYAVAMPKAFTLTPTSNGNPLPVNVACTSAASSALGSVTLTKQIPTLTAKAPKSVKANAKAEVKVSVANEHSKTGGAPVTGTVLVKEGAKTLGTGNIKNGKVTITLKKLKAGKHKLAVSYKGDQFTTKAKNTKLILSVIR